MRAVGVHWALIGLVVIVNPAKIMQHQAYIGLCIESGNDLCDFFRMPEIVLVAKKNQVLCATADGIFKIFNIAKIFLF